MQKIKVLHFSTHHENCGIGKYQEMFLKAMEGSEEVDNEFFETSPNQLRTMDAAQKQVVYNAFEAQLESFDILHIQHEFSFLHSEDFPVLVGIGKRLNKKVIITVHTSPTLAYEVPKLGGYSPRGVLHYLRLHKKKQFFDRVFTAAVTQADLVVAHNTVTANALSDLGVDRERIRTIVLPVPKLNFTTKNTIISQKLNRQPKDIIMATTGFLHKFKGIDQAIKALTYLPDNYKLAIVGGMHIDHNHKVYNDLTDLIRRLKLKDRVYITGYIEDDDTLNAMIRDCDICVYPYDRKYYSNISSASLNNGLRTTSRSLFILRRHLLSSIVESMR